MGILQTTKPRTDEVFVLLMKFNHPLDRKLCTSAKERFFFPSTFEVFEALISCSGLVVTCIIGTGSTFYGVTDCLS